MPGADPLTIVQASPVPWGSGGEVDLFVRRASAELAARGHRLAVIAPAASREAMRQASRELRAADDLESVAFGSPGGVKVLPIGGVPAPAGTRIRRTPVPGDSAKLIELVLGASPPDILHVHDPFTPSVPSTALRHSFSLNVGSFHEPQERLISTQLARPLVEIFFGRLDARTVTHRATAGLIDRYFPGAYSLVGGGADEAATVAGGTAPAWPVPEGGPLRIYFAATEERPALRTFLRALRQLPKGLDWQATIGLPDGLAPLPRMAQSVRDRVTFAALGRDTEPAEDLASHHLLCLASSGSAPVPSLIRQALHAGVVPVVSDLDLYSDLIGDGDAGLMFPPGDADTLAGQITRLAREPEGALNSLAGLRRRGSTSAVATRTWSEVAAELEGIYRATVARRHPLQSDQAVRRRLAGRPLIEVDLHMHTDHSSDCATPVRVLLETARDRGLGAIAITDHNEISGALAAREVAREIGGIKVIVGEEVKTAEQGEVIGLFLEEKIERGMTMAETIAEIRRQGGLVYVPHPFDRLHSVPDYEHLTEMVDEIDFMEVFNPRVAITSFNEEAERFARKYRITPAAGSDSHVAQGLGSVRVRIPDFEGAAEFREAMRDAEITRRHKNLVYVQALKFLQTTGRPKAPKRELTSAVPVRGGLPRRRV